MSGPSRRRPAPAVRRFSRLRHPLSGSPLGVLLRHLRASGPPSRRGLPTVALALVAAVLRWPFTMLEAAHVGRHRPATIPAPLFIIGHWRSGTTHLYTMLARSPAFATVSPIAAGLPLEHLLLGSWLRPLLQRTLPRDRFIDDIAVTADAPQEDEIAIAAMGGPSFLDAFHFPRQFERLLARGLFFDDAAVPIRAAWAARLERFYATLLMAQPGRRLLLKNPVYMARIPELLARWPDAQFIHIHRDPLEVFDSTRRLHASMLDNFALQRFDHLSIEATVLATYERLMRTFERDKRHLAPGQLAEISLDALRLDPETTLAGVYQRLGLADFAGAWPHFAVYCKAQGAYQPRPATFEPGAIRDTLIGWRTRLGSER